MFGLIESICDLGVEIFKFKNSKETTKYIDRLVSIKIELLHEKEKGYEADDGKIERLYKELQIILEAAKNEVIKSNN